MLPELLNDLRFLGAKAPLELAHVKNDNKENNGTEIFLIAYVCSCGAR